MQCGDRGGDRLFQSMLPHRERLYVFYSQLLYRVSIHTSFAGERHNIKVQILDSIKFQSTLPRRSDSYATEPLLHKVSVA
ncbi:hypothetical protein A8L34_28535 [Bacillus sp. FJAT-27264]|nr:hypothetical protein A8L34_28535 [Bacillus sp. FJAT-27264]